jgi:hypothetical protein
MSRQGNPALIAVRILSPSGGPPFEAQVMRDEKFEQVTGDAHDGCL